MIGKVFRDCFTGVDGSTYDLGRVLWGAAIGAPITAAYVQVLGYLVDFFGPHKPLRLWTPADWATWGTGVAALLVAGGASLFIKRGTEPSTVTTTAAARGPGASASVIERTQA